MNYVLKNEQAANNFLNQYDKQIQNLTIFPFGYRGTDIQYHDYEIHLKPFSTYNIFYIIDAIQRQIVILRILKDRQNWNYSLQAGNNYSFQ